MILTVGELIEQLKTCNPDLPVVFGDGTETNDVQCGLSFYRVKSRGGVIQIEFNEYPSHQDAKSVTYSK